MACHSLSDTTPVHVWQKPIRVRQQKLASFNTARIFETKDSPRQTWKTKRQKHVWHLTLMLLGRYWQWFQGRGGYNCSIYRWNEKQQKFRVYSCNMSASLHLLLFYQVSSSEACCVPWKITFYHHKMLPRGHLNLAGTCKTLAAMGMLSFFNLNLGFTIGRTQVIPIY